MRDGGTLRFAIKTSGAQAIKQDVAAHKAPFVSSTVRSASLSPVPLEVNFNITLQNGKVAFLVTSTVGIAPRVGIRF